MFGPPTSKFRLSHHVGCFLEHSAHEIQRLSCAPVLTARQVLLVNLRTRYCSRRSGFRGREFQCMVRAHLPFAPATHQKPVNRRRPPRHKTASHSSVCTSFVVAKPLPRYFLLLNGREHPARTEGHWWCHPPKPRSPSCFSAVNALTVQVRRVIDRLGQWQQILTTHGCPSQTKKTFQHSSSKYAFRANRFELFESPACSLFHFLRDNRHHFAQPPDACASACPRS